MAGALDFAGMVPGFDFLQGLMKGAGAGVPPMGQWVAPTLDPAELEKRINELRTVQFWLEQNAKLLGTTIQAMEVQRMTLATLKTMNLPLADLRESLKAVLPTPPTGAAASPSPPSDEATGTAVRPAIDPLQWWGALTQQFTDIASKAMTDGKPAAAPRAARPAAKASPKTAARKRRIAGA